MMIMPPFSTPTSGAEFSSLDLGLNLVVCMVHHLQPHSGRFQASAQTVCTTCRDWLGAVLANASPPGSIWVTD